MFCSTYRLYFTLCLLAATIAMSHRIGARTQEEPPTGLLVAAIAPESAKLYVRPSDGATKRITDLDEATKAKLGVSHAIQVEIAKEFQNVWDVQLCEMIGEQVHRGQPGLLRFWARSSVNDTVANTPAQVAVYLQRASEPWDKSFMTKLKLQQEWQLYEVPFRVHETFRKSEAQLCIGLGFSPQTVEFAAIQLTTFPLNVEIETLPKSLPN